MLEILSGAGKVIAVINPVPEQPASTLGGWLAGSGANSDTSGIIEPSFKKADASWSQETWQPLTAEQHAHLQKVPVVTSPEALLGDGTEEEWEGFDEALERWHTEQPVQPFIPHAA